MVERCALDPIQYVTWVRSSEWKYTLAACIDKLFLINLKLYSCMMSTENCIMLQRSKFVIIIIIIFFLLKKKCLKMWMKVIKTAQQVALSTSVGYSEQYCTFRWEGCQFTRTLTVWENIWMEPFWDKINYVPTGCWIKSSFL